MCNSLYADTAGLSIETQPCLSSETYKTPYHPISQFSRSQAKGFNWSNRFEICLGRLGGIAVETYTKFQSDGFILTHWGRLTHICVGNLNSIICDNGLSPTRRQAIIWTKAEKLLIGPLGTNISEVLIEIYMFSLKKIDLRCRLETVGPKPSRYPTMNRELGAIAICIYIASANAVISNQLYNVN